MHLKGIPGLSILKNLRLTKKVYIWLGTHKVQVIDLAYSGTRNNETYTQRYPVSNLEYCKVDLIPQLSNRIRISA